MGCAQGMVLVLLSIAIDRSCESPAGHSGRIMLGAVATKVLPLMKIRGGSAAAEDTQQWDFTKALNLEEDLINRGDSGAAEAHDPDYLEALSQSLNPEDWPTGAPGYNQNPFAGVKRPGWFLEEFVDPQSKDPHIQKLNKRLWKACDAGDASLASDLLSQAGLPDLRTNDTAAIAERKRIELVDCLLDHGARVQVTDIYGETPIHYAAVRGYPRLVQKLMEVGVDPFRENQFGNSAQRIAEMNQKHNPGCAEAAQVIADAGGYDTGWPADEMGREPPQQKQQRTKADWQWEQAEEEAEKALPEEMRLTREERQRGADDDLFAAVGGVPPHHFILPGKDGGPSTVRPELLRGEQEERLRQRIRKELERKAIMGEDLDDLTKEKEVWE